jgi:hypothetical protein
VSGRAWFLNRDPIEEQGGHNLYAFVRNNAINRWDYLGMVEVPDWWTGTEDEWAEYERQASAINPYDQTDGGINGFFGAYDNPYSIESADAFRAQGRAYADYLDQRYFAQREQEAIARDQARLAEAQRRVAAGQTVTIRDANGNLVTITGANSSSTAGLIASAGDGMYSDGSIPYVTRGGEAAAAGKGGGVFNDPRLVPGGVLTLAAANEHYRNGNGTPLMVIAGNLDFSGANPNGFNPTTGRQPFQFPASSGDFYIYGTVTLQRNPGGDTFRVLNDTYDFDMHSWTRQPVRNVATLLGEAVATRAGTSSGTPYQIIFFGNLDIPKPPPPPSPQKKDGS